MFFPTIARQRGIPVLVIGIICTIMPIFNIVIRPLTGYVTDRWNCRKQVFLGSTLLNALITPLIYFTPDFNDKKYAEALEIMTYWEFWIFMITVTVRLLLWMVGDVLQDTICLEMLGIVCYYCR